MADKEACGKSCPKKAKRMRWNKKAATRAMSVYLGYLAKQPAGEKTASVNRIPVLKFAFDRTGDIHKALAVTYPEKTAAARKDLAVKLAHALQLVAEKAAAKFRR